MFITKEMHRQVTILLEYAEAAIKKNHIEEARDYLTSAEALITQLELRAKLQLVKP